MGPLMQLKKTKRLTLQRILQNPPNRRSLCRPPPSRDLMIHLPPRHNLKILQNIQASGARLFMATTFLDGDENLIADTFKPAAGHFINLALPPYCLRPPDALFKDFTGVKHDKRMGLWELDSGRPLIGGSGEHYCGHVTWR